MPGQARYYQREGKSGLLGLQSQQNDYASVVAGQVGKRSTVLLAISAQVPVWSVHFTIDIIYQKLPFIIFKPLEILHGGI